MLLNEAEPILRAGARIHLAGIDDAHFYRVDNIEKAASRHPDRVSSRSCCRTRRRSTDRRRTRVSTSCSRATRMAGRSACPGRSRSRSIPTCPGRSAPVPGAITAWPATPRSAPGRAWSPFASTARPRSRCTGWSAPRVSRAGRGSRSRTGSATAAARRSKTTPSPPTMSAQLSPSAGPQASSGRSDSGTWSRPGAMLLGGSPRRRLMKLESRSPAIAAAATSAPSRQERPISRAAATVASRAAASPRKVLDRPSQRLAVEEPGAEIERPCAPPVQEFVGQDGSPVRRQEENHNQQDGVGMHGRIVARDWPVATRAAPTWRPNRGFDGPWYRDQPGLSLKAPVASGRSRVRPPA